MQRKFIANDVISESDQPKIRTIRKTLYENLNKFLVQIKLKSKFNIKLKIKSIGIITNKAETKF